MDERVRTTAVIEFSGFTKRYRDRIVVEQLSFSVPAGRLVGLVSPSGTGKSTALHGLLRPTSGRALVFGTPYVELDRPALRVGAHVGGIGFGTHITGRRHLEVCAAASGVSRNRVDEVLALCGLTEGAGSRLEDYSPGMMQRLGLATALIGDPQLLVLDEPANGLPPAGVAWLWQFLRFCAGNGGTVLLTSRQLGELAQVLDEVVIIDRRAVFAGPPAELAADTGRPEHRTLEEL